MRTLDLLKQLNKEQGIPFAYHHFSEGESPTPPFIVYLYPGSDNFAADDRVYFPITEVNVELYTDRKDTRLERLLEDSFSEANIFWDKTEVWIESERLYEVVYSYQEAVETTTDTR